MTPSFQHVYNALFQDLVTWGLAVIALGVVAAGARWIMRLLSDG
jgi:hypothetical protein